MRNNILFFIAVLAIGTLSMAGCGGGGGGGGAPAPGLVSKGVITATGSIFVNGAFYNISSASIKLDGLPGTKSDLKPGMVVTVKGIFNNSTSHTIRRPATSVEFDDNLEGPVDSVNAFNPSLIMMGQPVVLTTSTVYNNSVFSNFSSLRNSLRQLQPGSVVQVSGFKDNGIGAFFHATRIDLIALAIAPTTPTEIKGTLSSLDMIMKTFNIGGLKVDFSTINPVYLPIPLANGQFVKVTGLGSDYTPGAAPTLVAKGVKVIKEGITANEGDHVVVEGYVSGLSGNSFTIEGTPVNAGTLSLLNIANSSNVRVEGTFSNGVLMASKITPL